MDIGDGKGGRTEIRGAGWAASVSEPGMLLAAITMVCLTAGIVYGSPDISFFSVIWFCMALGFGVGMLLIRLGCLEAWSQPGWARSEILCLVICGICMAAFSYWCGMRQFGGFDQSVVVDVGWRLYSGQQPYTDFICTLPVGFYLGAELAYRWFGVFWSSIIKLNVLYLLITYFWTYAVLRHVFQDKYLAMVLVITCECMSLILASYWWYNPVTSMAVWIENRYDPIAMMDFSFMNKKLMETVLNSYVLERSVPMRSDAGPPDHHESQKIGGAPISQLARIPSGKEFD